MPYKLSGAKIANFMDKNGVLYTTRTCVIMIFALMANGRKVIQMRLIDADELKKKENMDYVKISTWDEDKQEFVLGTIGYISPDSVDRAKTVDAVPVVRCKDCKHYDNYIGDCMECDRFVCDDDYCSFGELKDGEQE